MTCNHAHNDPPVAVLCSEKTQIVEDLVYFVDLSLLEAILTRVATCAIFRRKVRYVRSIYGVRWSALYLLCFHKI